MQHLMPNEGSAISHLTHFGINGRVKTRFAIREHKHPYSQLRQAELIVKDLEIAIAIKSYENTKRSRWRWLWKLWHKWILGLFDPRAAIAWEHLDGLVKASSEFELEDAMDELAVARSEQARLLQEHPHLLDPERRLEMEQEAHYQMLASRFVAERLAIAQGIPSGYAQLLISLSDADRASLALEYERQMEPVLLRSPNQAPIDDDRHNLPL